MDCVLVTGACGLVGRSVVARLLADGCRVVVTDLDTPANRRAVRSYAGVPAVTVRWADLTDPAEVAGLLAETAPDVVIHLAAVIPPGCYAAPQVARAVNVDGTRHLVEAAERIHRPPRLVLASSMAVHGSRNPHRDPGVLTEATPVAPSDLYGGHKAEAERIVRESSLDWVVLRLGGVLTTEASTAGGLDLLHFDALLPADGRLQTVDVRDVARAFAAASRGDAADVVGETFLVGGDETHRRTQEDVGRGLVAAMGLEDGLPRGRPGDPADDSAWFATDWMDTGPSQARLDYQRHSWPALVDEVRERAGRRRYLLRLVAPVLHAVLERRSPYRDHPGRYADPWRAIGARWGDPAPDQPAS